MTAGRVPTVNRCQEKEAPPAYEALRMSEQLSSTLSLEGPYPLDIQERVLFGSHHDRVVQITPGAVPLHYVGR